MEDVKVLPVPQCCLECTRDQEECIFCEHYAEAYIQSNSSISLESE